MLNLYRRHTPDCDYREKGIQYTKCNCPIWVTGHLWNKAIRKTMKTRNWGRAEKELERWLGTPKNGSPSLPDPKEEEGGFTVADAMKAYLDSLETKERAESTVRSYRTTLARLQSFLEGRGVTRIDKISLLDLEQFQAMRRLTGDARKKDKLAPKTQRKEMEHLRNFLSYARKHKWVVYNEALGLEAAADNGVPTLPFEPSEVHRLLDACDLLDNKHSKYIEFSRLRMRALILVLCHSGLRISDAVQLKRSQIKATPAGHELLLRQQKTGVWVGVALPPDVMAALKAIPAHPDSPNVISPYYFWTGESKLMTATSSMRRIMDVLRKKTGINCHPHRFRDTFAVTLLNQGEDIRTVQLLLGHTSIRTTEKHYAPFMQTTKERLWAATAKLDFLTREATTGGQVIEFPSQP